MVTEDYVIASTPPAVTLSIDILNKQHCAAVSLDYSVYTTGIKHSSSISDMKTKCDRLVALVSFDSDAIPITG